MRQNECVVMAAPTPSVPGLRRSARLRLAFKDKLMPANKSFESSSPTQEMESCLPELRRSIRIGPTNKRVRCEEEAPSVTMKKTKISGRAVHRLLKKMEDDLNDYIYRASFRYAWKGLELYQKRHSKDVEFEITKVLYLNRLRIGVRKATGYKYCAHICFIVQPKNSHSNDASPRHFFAELMMDRSNYWNAKYCYPFKPPNKGRKHRCVICPPGTTIHPCPSKYRLGDGKSYVPRDALF